MEGNWIEIKRFLDDNKNTILIGSTTIALLLTAIIFILGVLKEDSKQEERKDFEIPAEKILNDEQPAYFQVYIENEDGTIFGNTSIIKQYFNLNSVKKEIKENTGIDIKLIEEEVYLNDLSEEIEVIDVLRNDSSYLLTAVFNLGKEQDNLIVAKYYYNLLYSEDFSILSNKKSIIFSEPIIATSNISEQRADSLRLKEKKSTDFTLENIISIIKNIVIGFIFGVIIMIGVKLLKVIYGKTLDYSFGYEVEEEVEFLLYDKQLENAAIVSQFINTPHDSRKIIVVEESIDSKKWKLLHDNEQIILNNNVKEKDKFKEVSNLGELDNSLENVVIVIIVYPELTTRKWYRTQKQIAVINKFPIKVIQINQ